MNPYDVLALVAIVVVGGILHSWIQARPAARSQAQPPVEAPNPPLVTRVSLQLIADLLNEEGFAATVAGGQVTVKVGDAGQAVITQSKDATSLGCAYTVKGAKAATLERVNSWNRTKGWLRAYLDEHADPCVRMEYDVKEGVTRAAVAQHLRTYLHMLPDFVSHVSEGRLRRQADAVS